MIVQKLKKESKSDVFLAQRYYSLISALNELGLTEREVQLMGFIAVYGSVSNADNRKNFCEEYQTTSATVNNIVSRLKKRNLLIKSDGKIVVNPIISLDFSKDVTLEIKLLHERKT